LLFDGLWGCEGGGDERGFLIGVVFFAGEGIWDKIVFIDELDVLINKIFL
jgi:hypothetical protein